MGGSKSSTVTDDLTPQQQAYQDAQSRSLSKEIRTENRRRKALLRGQLGAESLLSAATANADATVSNKSAAQGSKGEQGGAPSAPAKSWKKSNPAGGGFGGGLFGGQVL